MRTIFSNLAFIDRPFRNPISCCRRWTTRICTTRSFTWLSPHTKQTSCLAIGRIFKDQISSSGLRDVEHSITKAKGVTRIALLGDSTTEGLQVPLNDTFARVLANILNNNGKQKFETINFACSSFSTAQEVIQFENDVVAYQPDLVVLLYNNGDDKENIRDVRSSNVEPRPYFYLDNNDNLKLDTSVLQAQYGNSINNPLLAFLRKNSCIYGVMSQMNLTLSIDEPLYRKIIRLIKKFDALAHGKKFGKDAYAVYPQPNAWLVTDKLVSRLNEDCKRHGCQLVVMTFPNTLSDVDLKRESAQLLSKSKSNGFGFIDLTDVFNNTANINSLFLQYHFSTHGHELIAHVLANYLQTKKWRFDAELCKGA